MNKKNKILGEAAILLIVVTLVLSTIVTSAQTQINNSDLTVSMPKAGTGVGSDGPVVWDNLMHYDGLAAAQWDNVLMLDAHPADDFFFEEPTEVYDVHWIGGYWGGDPAEFDWCISFYFDDGTGTAPVGVPYNPSYAGPFCYTWVDINKEEIAPGEYEMWIDLPYGIPFEPGKYWISIWAVGQYPPQSGWGYHIDPILLNQAVFGSTYFGFPFWTDGELVFGEPIDMAFQLTTLGGGPGVLCCDPGLLNWVDVPAGGTVHGSFFVWNCGDPFTILNWQVDSWPSWGTWTFSPPAGVLLEGEGVTVDVTVVAPPEKKETFTGIIKVINADDPTNFCEMQTDLATPRFNSFNIMFNPIQWLFELFPNAFPLLRYLIQI